MTTLNTPHEAQSSAPGGRRASPSWAGLILGLLVALVVGGLGGWLARGATDDASAYVAGGGALTERQEQMVDLIQDSGEAWATGDAQALEGMFADDGTFTVFDVTYRMDDGSLQAYMDETSFPGLKLYGPIVVRGNQAVMFHNYATFGDIADVFEFTPEGELMIVSHEVMVG